MPEIEHRMTEEQLEALFRGSKLVLEYGNMPRVTIYPPNHGVFLPMKQLQMVRQLIVTHSDPTVAAHMLELLKPE